MQAAEEVSGKTLGSGWYSREDCPSTLPAGANLQAAHPELRHVQLDTPELVSWSIMLPTSARVAQEVCEPLIGTLPNALQRENGTWQIGTSSIRAEAQLATGFRFVNWVPRIRM